WLILSVFNHYYIISYWEDEKRTQVWWHRIEAAIRGLLLFNILVYHTGLTVSLISWMSICLSLWWLFFDMFLNLKRKKHLLYVGDNSLFDITTKKISGYMSLLLKKIPYKSFENIEIPSGSTSLILKLIVLLLSILSLAV